MITAGQRFRASLSKSTPMQIVGTVNAYCAILAKAAKMDAIYLSGGALAAVSYGLPDLGVINLEDMLTDVRRITDVVDTPLIVDIDTGFGDHLSIERTIKSMIKFGAAGIHIEDQVSQKRCGHRPNKNLVSIEEMSNRLRSAHNTRQQIDKSFYLIARTDAIASEGLNSAIERAIAYQAIGVDAIFVEACSSLEDYHAFVDVLDIPVMANITEFGQTPLYTCEQLKSVGISMVLYPFTATRMMNKAALTAYQCLKEKGTQQSLIMRRHTRLCQVTGVDVCFRSPFHALG
jgi:methylisocitrate lyase